MTESQRKNAESQRKLPDREKAFDALRNCITVPKCRDCPWEDCERVGHKKTTVPVTLLLDVLELLKEQEPVGVEKGIGYLYCGGCSTALAPLDWPKPWKFCPWCGRKVKWDA